jgi:hypothetical protein
MRAARVALAHVTLSGAARVACSARVARSLPSAPLSGEPRPSALDHRTQNVEP